MAQLITIWIIVVLSGVASASDPLWTSLKVTIPFFYDIPLTRTAAESLGWHSISGRDCRNNGRFQGYRYIYDDDYSFSVLYDVQGSLAGLQTNMLVKELQAGGNQFQFNRVPMYQRNTLNGTQYYTFTAYIQNPALICIIGRNPSQYEKNGIGTDLYFQNGIYNYIKAPKDRKDALKTRIWSNNNCFPHMGYHNFYKVETWARDNCTSIMPVFLLYNNDGRLHGFGFDVVGTAISTRFENPNFTNIETIIGDMIPSCVEPLFDTVGITTMHAYFIADPQQFLCA